MDCVNHSGVNATAFCQNCGKPLCQACVKTGAGGQIFCEPCWMAWQGGQQPLVPPPMGATQSGAGGASGPDSRRWRHVQRPVDQGAHPCADLRGAGERGPRVRNLWALHRGLGLLPGFRGLPHGEGAARRRTVARSLGAERADQLVWRRRTNEPGNAARGAAGSGAGELHTGAGQVPNQAPNQAQYEPPYQTPYQTPYQGPNVPPGYAGPDFPPVPPVYWRRKEPIGAIILIALGVLFLLGHFDWFSGRVFEFTWPILLIGLGVWLMVRRLSETKASSQGNSRTGSQGNSQGGQQ